MAPFVKKIYTSFQVCIEWSPAHEQERRISRPWLWTVRQRRLGVQRRLGRVLLDAFEASPPRQTSASTVDCSRAAAPLFQLRA